MYEGNEGQGSTLCNHLDPQLTSEGFCALHVHIVMYTYGSNALIVLYMIYIPFCKCLVTGPPVAEYQLASL